MSATPKATLNTAAAGTTVRASELSLKYSLDKTSRELLYLPLPLGLKRRVKVFIDTFVERASRGLAGLELLPHSRLAEYRDLPRPGDH